MIRPPSLQHTYDEFFSGDEAFVQLVANPSPEEADEHARKWKIARETGDFAALHITGIEPTKFVLRPVPGHLFRKLVDLAVAGDIGGAELNILSLRLALVDVANLALPTEHGSAAAKVKFVNDPAFGKIADVEVPNALDRADYKIVNELAVLIRERAQAVSPKS